MAFEPPTLHQHTAPNGPHSGHRADAGRDEQGGSLARNIVAVLFAVCGGLAALFLFFAAMGAVDLGDALAATIVAAIMGLIWFGAFYYRQRTGAGRVQWRDRERRGF